MIRRLAGPLLLAAATPIAAPALVAEAPATPRAIDLVATPGRHGLVEVPVRINGHLDARFIVDTAATQTVLAQPTVTALGLRGSGRPARVDTATGTARLDNYSLRSLALGASVYRDLDAFALAPGYGELGADGLIGADVLQRHVVLFDLARGTIALYPRRTDAARIPGDWLEMPLTRRREGYVLVDIRVGDSAIPALLDTGAAHSIVNGRAAALLGLEAIDGEPFPITGASGQIQIMRRALLSGLTIGGSPLADAEIGIADLPVFDTLGLADGPAMILGIEALAGQRFVIDYPGSRLLVAR